MLRSGTWNLEPEHSEDTVFKDKQEYFLIGAADKKYDLEIKRSAMLRLYRMDEYSWEHSLCKYTHSFSKYRKKGEKSKCEDVLPHGDLRWQHHLQRYKWHI